MNNTLEECERLLKTIYQHFIKTHNDRNVYYEAYIKLKKENDYLKQILREKQIHLNNYNVKFTYD
tara:strand:- start:73 stop:267 length:195 start_codon:yes stop_codon:yes gene_type:complete